jgi:MoxR-like ATPase
VTERLPHDRLEQVRLELRRVVVGQDRMLDRLLASVLAEGHCLLEGVPGLGKTLTLATLARVIGGTFSRIQFTADLIPADIVGTRIYRPSSETFDVEPGPVLANVVLADEINRAPAKVQSALLEVMQERQVTIGGRTLTAPRPFIVVATQNPIESEGVYQLPEAQRDRFLMRIPVDYPTPAEEREILARFEGTAPMASRLLDPEDVVALQAAARAVRMDEATVDYATRVVLATREPARYGVPEIAGQLEYGASPRASLGMVRAAKALALIRGRTQATPQDVYDVAYDVLNLRLVLSYAALADGVTIDDVVVRLLRKVPATGSPAAWHGVGAGIPAPTAAQPNTWSLAPSTTATQPTQAAPMVVPPSPSAPVPAARPVDPAATTEPVRLAAQPIAAPAAGPQPGPIQPAAPQPALGQPAMPQPPTMPPTPAAPLWRPDDPIVTEGTGPTYGIAP